MYVICPTDSANLGDWGRRYTPLYRLYRTISPWMEEPQLFRTKGCVFLFLPNTDAGSGIVQSAHQIYQVWREISCPVVVPLLVSHTILWYGHVCMIWYNIPLPPPATIRTGASHLHHDYMRIICSLDQKRNCVYIWYMYTTWFDVPGRKWLRGSEKKRVKWGPYYRDRPGGRVVRLYYSPGFPWRCWTGIKCYKSSCHGIQPWKKLAWRWMACIVWLSCRFAKNNGPSRLVVFFS